MSWRLQHLARLSTGQFLAVYLADGDHGEENLVYQIRESEGAGTRPVGRAFFVPRADGSQVIDSTDRALGVRRPTEDDRVGRLEAEVAGLRALVQRKQDYIDSLVADAQALIEHYEKS